MLQISSFTFNPFQENTYIIHNEENECWIVDPGMYDQSEKIFLADYIKRKNWTPRFIINTHCHLDHIFGAKYLIDEFNIGFKINELELEILKNAKNSASLFGLNFNDIPTPTELIDQNSELNLGNNRINVFHTPGHSPGSISFYSKDSNWVLSGDTLFQNSIGRTDLPGGHHETLLKSIKEKLFSLPEETIVYSGHGPKTTIGHEKNNNPFF